MAAAVLLLAPGFFCLMNQAPTNPWLHRFAVLTALATLGLVGMGGLVTSHGVGMAVPDWPTSYGYNMFALPISMWLTGGVFHEHTHRLWASLVGVLVVALTRWLGGRESMRPLLVVGAIELLAGFALLKLGPDWRGAGHFLQGIGGVVLLAGLVWSRNPRASGRLPQLGWAAFWLVQFQGLLGGLRVVLDAHVLADVRLGTAFGIFHGCLAQAFLVLLAVIALFTSRWWIVRSAGFSLSGGHETVSISRPVLIATALIFLQLLIGATMRHQHAGLAISDFPLAHGKLWPDLGPEAIARYNAQRIEIVASHPITAAQIVLQMTHRLMALLILASVSAVAWQARKLPGPFRRFAWFWLGLILAQAALGAWTIWSNKAADVATAHVVVGALSLVTGALASIITLRRFYPSGAAIPAGASFDAVRPGILSIPPANP
jgi:cytochrome c oxidase assembly protein subunit 15